MSENDCAYPGCTGFSMSQCRDCGQRYCTRHKDLVADYCAVCQLSSRRRAPRYMFMGILLIALPVLAYFLLVVGLQVRALAITANTGEGIAFLVGLLGLGVLGLIIF